MFKATNWEWLILHSPPQHCVRFLHLFQRTYMSCSQQATRKQRNINCGTTWNILKEPQNRDIQNILYMHPHTNRFYLAGKINQWMGICLCTPLKHHCLWNNWTIHLQTHKSTTKEFVNENQMATRYVCFPFPIPKGHVISYKAIHNTVQSTCNIALANLLAIK